MWLDKDGNKIDNISQIPQTAEGFVYIIVNLSKGKLYIGKKSLYSKKWKVIGKKTYDILKEEGSEVKKVKKKGSKRGNPIWGYRTFTTTESNWLNYTGSNIELNKDIKEGDKIEKRIIQFAFSQKQLTYMELHWLIVEAVLFKDNYYNDNVLGKFYSSDFTIN